MPLSSLAVLQRHSRYDSAGGIRGRPAATAAEFFSPLPPPPPTPNPAAGCPSPKPTTAGPGAIWCGEGGAKGGCSRLKKLAVAAASSGDKAGGAPYEQHATDGVILGHSLANKSERAAQRQAQENGSRWCCRDFTATWH